MMTAFARIMIFLAACCFLPAALQAQSTVTLQSDIAVERTIIGADGKATTIFEAPQIVVPGDALRFTLTYTNTGSAATNNFTVTNPLPQAVKFIRAEQDWATLSVDNGRTWGNLNDLFVREGTVSRPATQNDVTHIRWVFAKPIGPGEQGKLHFRGIVR